MHEVMVWIAAARQSDWCYTLEYQFGVVENNAKYAQKEF